MKEYKWTSASIRPKEGEPLACISTTTDGSIKYTNFGDDSNGPYRYLPNKKCPEWAIPYHEGYFNNDGWSVSFDYWMYWDDFWEMLEDLPRVEKEKEDD
jgi:hypothetical protein